MSEDLASAGWVDGSTLVLEAASVSIVPSLQRWFRASTRLGVESGGVFTGGIDTCVVRLAPYSDSAAVWGVAGDLGCIVGAVVLCVVAARELLTDWRGVSFVEALRGFFPGVWWAGVLTWPLRSPWP